MFGEVREIIDAHAKLCAHKSECVLPFKATEIYSEGWMLRLLVSYLRDCPLTKLKNKEARFISEAAKRGWRSEGLLYPMFRRERPTYADGIVGDLLLRKNTKWGFEIASAKNAMFAVLEAKMQAPLSRSTESTKDSVVGFNQAARNIACIAGILARQSTGEAEGRLIVLAPELHIEGIGSVVDAAYNVVRNEVEGNRGRHAFREDVCPRGIFLKYAKKVAESSVALSWDDLIEALPSGEEREYIFKYYQNALKVNGVK